MFQKNRLPACDHVVHVSHPAWVLVAYAPQKNDADYVRVACHEHEGGKAIMTFFSPLDAMIEAAYLANPPTEFFQHIFFDHFDPRIFANDHQGDIRLMLNIGYAASDHRIVVRKDKLVPIAEILTLKPDISRLPIALEIEDSTYKNYLDTRKRAGLFACEETLAMMVKQPWKDDALHKEVAWAIASIPEQVTYSDGLDINQVAMYDPEYKQWHFVSLDNEET